MSTDNSAPAGDLENAVASLEERIARQVAALRNGNRVFLIIGIVLAIAIFVWLSLVTNKLNSYLREPETLAHLFLDAAGDKLDPALNELKKNLADNRQKNVEAARKELMKQLPSQRVQLEKTLVKRLTREIVTVLQAHLDDIVKDMIKEDKDKLNPLIDKASSDQGQAELTKEFTELFAKGVGEPLKDELDKDYNKTLDDMLNYLRKLRTSRNLSPKEEYEKERITEFMIMLANLLSETAEDPLGMEKKPEKPKEGAGASM